jgi:hypothetical protein
LVVVADGRKWSGAFGGDLGEEVLESFALLFGDYHGDAHAEAGFDAFDEAIDFDGHFDADVGGEACADPERVGRFNEHAVGADITSAGAKNGGAPFDLEIGAVVIARSPAALQPSRMVPTGHG